MGVRSGFAYRMPFAQRTDVEESVGLLALEDLQRRDLPCASNMRFGFDTVQSW